MIALTDEGRKNLGDSRGRERERGDTLHLTHIAQRMMILTLILLIVTLTHILHQRAQHQVMKGKGGRNRKETGIGEEKERGTIVERSDEDRVKDHGTS